MSTRSMIALQTGPDEYKAIYCHYDGYLSYVGAILLDHYNTKEKLEKLLELGDLSTLDIKTDPDTNFPHSFEFSQRQDDVCVAYGRDRGETGTEAKIMTLHELVNVDWVQYVYILGPDNEWNYYSYNYDDMENLRNVKEDLDMEYRKMGIKRPKNFYGVMSDEMIAEEKIRQANSDQGAEM